MEREARVDEIIGSETVALLRSIDAREHGEYVRGFKALMLAPTVTLYHALMRGERVPWNTLSYWQAERFGLRRRHGDGRYGVDDFNDVRRDGS